MKTTKMILIACLLASGGCGAAEELPAFGLTGKGDYGNFTNQDDLSLGTRERKTITFRGEGAFRISLSQEHRDASEQALMQLFLKFAGAPDDSEIPSEKDYKLTTIEYTPNVEGEQTYELTLWNRSTSRELKDGRLRIDPIGGSTTGDRKLRYKSYRVLFTNPLCKSYEYDEPLLSADGSVELTRKPKNVYCTKSDWGASVSRPVSPQPNLEEWIRGTAPGDEIFLAYLSFSNSGIADALCEAAQNGVTVNFVLAGPTSKTSQLTGCGGKVHYRGHSGGIGYAHNKVLMINPNGSASADPDYMKMTFSSGNMSSGAAMHHENWHFIEVARKSYFAEAHRCLMKAQLDEDASSSKAKYKAYMDDCRAQIPYEQEEDIRAFFIPNESDSWAVTDLLKETTKEATSADVGAHRFGYTALVNALRYELRDDPSFSVRMVADDDIYWVGHGEPVGDNMYFEYENVQDLETAGGDRFAVKYMQTNHEQHLLHHNKFVIYSGRPYKPDAVLCGAANLTGTGFWDNFENIYWIEIPHVVEAFQTQFARFWDGQKGSPEEQEPPMATPPELMPETNEMP